MLLLLFFSALLLLASLCSLFSFLGTCRRVQHGQHSVLVSRLFACSLSGFEALFYVAWFGADAIGRCYVLLRVLHARTLFPTATSSPLSRNRGTLYLPVIDLAPRGEGGMVASAEEAESSASSASSDGPPHRQPSPRTPRMGLVKGKTLFKVYVSTNMHSRD